ncbi:hypothetical protein bcCo53_001117 (plasmid) [Borrelia coriaceae]|nr:hypothetical protein [Borrelia coriaceae]UPA16949.1 hypothetical protein bcCo53_001117 [Borrelia coriaceae]
MKLTKKYLLAVLLLSLINCDLLSKNKILTSHLLNTLDNNKKEALVTFKNLLQDKSHLEYLKSEQAKMLTNFTEDDGIEQPHLQEKLKGTLSSEYNENQLNQLFSELGYEKTKQFLDNLHKMLQAIKDGTLRAFHDSSSFKDYNTTLEAKKAEALSSVKKELYVQYYFYINDLQTADDFFVLTRNHLMIFKNNL